MNAGIEQALACVDVANANHDIACQQHLLDGSTALARLLKQPLAQRRVCEGLYTQTAEQNMLLNVTVLIGVLQHRTEPARIGQAHYMCAELQIEVIVFLRWHMVR